MINVALRGKAALLIDGDPSIRGAAAEMLERWDCAAVTAESAAQALELIGMSGFSPDAIIADHRLRDGLTGLYAICALHARVDRVPTAILTGDMVPDRLRETHPRFSVNAQASYGSKAAYFVVRSACRSRAQ